MPLLPAGSADPGPAGELHSKAEIAFAYKDLPLPMHPHAQKAAEASQCAGLQGKYWEYHDLLLKTKNLEVPQFKAGARQLGLETAAFDKCLDSGERADAVKSSLRTKRKSWGSRVHQVFS